MKKNPKERRDFVIIVMLSSGMSDLQSEAKIQQSIVEHYRNNYCLKHHSPRGIIFHVPNQNQHKLTNIGVMAGVSDLIVIHPTQKTESGSVLLFIEVKEPGKGKQSPSQKEFEEQVRGLNRSYRIVTSKEDFIAIINFWD